MNAYNLKRIQTKNIGIWGHKINLRDWSLDILDFYRKGGEEYFHFYSKALGYQKLAEKKNKTELKINLPLYTYSKDWNLYTALL